MPVQGSLQRNYLLPDCCGLAGAPRMAPGMEGYGPVKVATILLLWLQSMCLVPALRTMIGALLLCTSHGE